MYPIMSTGNTVSKAVNVLKEHGVKEECIILSNLFCTPQAVQAVLESYPKVIFVVLYICTTLQHVLLFPDEDFHL